MFKIQNWIPAFAGMTRGAGMTLRRHSERNEVERRISWFLQR
jgi:hypothetical protein